jgi:hypothetical protein
MRDEEWREGEILFMLENVGYEHSDEELLRKLYLVCILEVGFMGFEK